ncbi:MAG TPA: hypothetical protein VHE79_00615 [Spirochaetia bacterium]
MTRAAPLPPPVVPATPIEVYTLDGTTFFGDGAEHEALDLPVPEPWTFYDVYAGCYGDPHPAGASC